MSNLVDIFNDSAKSFIMSQKWMSIDKNLTPFERKKISINLTTVETKLLNLDIESELVSVVRNQINQDISKNIINKLFDTQSFDYLDLRPNGSIMSGRAHLEKLVGLILNNDYKNLITTGLISSQLMDSSAFSAAYMVTDDVKISGRPECLGKLGGRIDVYNDPYMKFNDGRICMFKEVYYNIGDIKSYMSNSQYAPQFVVEYEISYNVGDSKLIFVIEDENSEAFNQYKSLQRDIKINKIINYF